MRYEEDHADEEFEPVFEEEEFEFESDDDLEAALDDRASRFDRLKVRGREAFQSVAERGRERLYDAADRRKDRIAEVLDTAAGRLDDRLSDTAAYLRTRDLDGIRDDLVRQIRRHPLLSAGIAVGAGYLAGRVVAGKYLPGRTRSRRSKVARQVTRAMVSTLGAMVAAKLKEGLEQPAEEPEA